MLSYLDILQRESCLCSLSFALLCEKDSVRVLSDGAQVFGRFEVSVCLPKVESRHVQTVLARFQARPLST